MAYGLERRIFMVCPVRGQTDEEKHFLEQYVAKLESAGHKVHLPHRDTDQNDPLGGIGICTQNRDAIRAADEVHVYYNSTSLGSYFDFGMLFMADKPVKVVNIDQVESIQGKDFKNVLRSLHQKYAGTTL